MSASATAADPGRSLQIRRVACGADTQRAPARVTLDDDLVHRASAIRQRIAFACVAVCTSAVSAAAQPADLKREAAALNIDSMRASRGATFTRHASPHFELHTEYPGTHATRMLDSLEAAFAHATTLLGGPFGDPGRITVFVTASRTRFPLAMSPTNKGLMARSRPDGREFIVLVVNDSVRSYARHEVMHALAFRAWGAAHGAAEWKAEGLATFADGLCQDVPIVVVARDLLRRQPVLTARDVTERFASLAAASRHGAYVLAASLVEFLWNTRGRDGFKRVWTGADSLTGSGGTPWGLPNASANVDREWRAYVERVAGTRPGPTPETLQRHGCG